MTHKLNSPHDWLLDKAQHWNADALYKALSGLAYRVDGYSIRDLFQSEMESDGYFEKKTNADDLDAESWGRSRGDSSVCDSGARQTRMEMSQLALTTASFA